MAEKEYIEREAALEAATYNHIVEPTELSIVDLTLAVARKHIRKIPAADVVEVVRCKDCKYWQQVNTERHACYYLGFEMDYDEYCSYGKRRTD